jgi:DHA1 family inner membrane transport protein
MTRTTGIVPAGPSGPASLPYPGGRLLLPTLSVVAAATAMAVLATQTTGEMLDYSVGVVPVVAPWLTACLSVAVAVLGLRERWVVSAAGSLLIGALVLVTAWSIVMLPFDALRIVGLVPLPLSSWGLVLRLLLLLAAATALLPAFRIRQAHQQRCPACHRVLPGTLDRVPRWPVAIAVVASLVYPALRTIWALGGTFGTTGEPLDLDPALAWGVVVVGLGLVAFTLLLLVGKGPLWARALFGLGGLAAGLALAMIGGLAATRSATLLATEGLQSSQGDELMTWTFLLVYGSWFVAGLGVIAGSWRYWAHRRDDCAGCRDLLEP